MNLLAFAAVLLLGSGTLKAADNLQHAVPQQKPKAKAKLETPLKPGVYRTEPFSCLVIVPRSDLDPNGVIGIEKAPEWYTPVIKPPLRFVPWKAKK